MAWHCAAEVCLCPPELETAKTPCLTAALSGLQGSLKCSYMLQYYTPAILELAGFRSTRTALLLAMLPAGVNSVGTLVGMWQIDRQGRR